MAKYSSIWEGRKGRRHKHTLSILGRISNRRQRALWLLMGGRHHILPVHAARQLPRDLAVQFLLERGHLASSDLFLVDLSFRNNNFLSGPSVDKPSLLALNVLPKYSARHLERCQGGPLLYPLVEPLDAIAADVVAVPVGAPGSMCFRLLLESANDRVGPVDGPPNLLGRFRAEEASAASCGQAVGQMEELIADPTFLVFFGEFAESVLSTGSFEWTGLFVTLLATFEYSGRF